MRIRCHRCGSDLGEVQPEAGLIVLQRKIEREDVDEPDWGEVRERRWQVEVPIGADEVSYCVKCGVRRLVTADAVATGIANRRSTLRV